MTRSMGDATHDNVAQLAAAGPWDLVAGYVTGSPDIKWTTADWAQFPLAVQVSIDQGFTGSPVPWATVRDVEQFAWTVPAAVDRSNWTAARPTIYISLSRLPELNAAGWQGDVWVADWTGSPPAAPPAMPAGMTCVAVQYANGAMLGTTYDLSVVFDPAWPMKGDPMAVTIAGVPGTWAAYPQSFTSAAGVPYLIGYGWNGSQSDGIVWMTKFTGGAWTAPVPL